jgi:hypothetical protein
MLALHLLLLPTATHNVIGRIVISDDGRTKTIYSISCTTTNLITCSSIFCTTTVVFAAALFVPTTVVSGPVAVFPVPIFVTAAYTFAVNKAVAITDN